MKKISRFKGPEQSPGFLLWHVSTEWRRQIEAALLTLGITHAQFVLLANVGWLNHNQTEVTQVELARHCKMDITMTSQVLRTLERKGYIERVQRAGDERSKLPRLTPKGVKLVVLAIPLIEKIDHEFFSKLGKDLSGCISILQKLALGEQTTK